MIFLAKRIAAWLAFTKSEQRILFFLVGAFVLGSVVRSLQGDGGPGVASSDPRNDSLFIVLSSLDLGHPDDGLAPLLNVNTASQAELVALPGIGEVTAERIVLYRDEFGPFTSINQLLRVKGISKKKLEQLKALITIH